MYNAGAGLTTGGVLASTGVGTLWAALAAFALIAAGSAVKRVIPVRVRNK